MSSTVNDTMTFAFQGSAIFLKGSLGNITGSFSVKVNDGDGMFHSVIPGQAGSVDSRPSALHFQGGLDPTKQHTLTFTNLGNNQIFIDSFVVYRYVSLKPR